MGSVVLEEHISVLILADVLNMDYVEQSAKDEDDACYVAVDGDDDAKRRTKLSDGRSFVTNVAQLRKMLRDGRS